MLPVAYLVRSVSAISACPPLPNLQYITHLLPFLPLSFFFGSCTFKMLISAVEYHCIKLYELEDDDASALSWSELAVPVHAKHQIPVLCDISSTRLRCYECVALQSVDVLRVEIEFECALRTRTAVERWPRERLSTHMAPAAASYCGLQITSRPAHRSSNPSTKSRKRHLSVNS